MPPNCEVVPMQTFWSLQCRWLDACHGCCGTHYHMCTASIAAQRSASLIFDTMVLSPSEQLLLKSEAGVNWQLSEALRKLSENTTMGRSLLQL